MSEPSSAADAKVNWVALASLVLGVVSIFFNPYLLTSVIAIVLGIVAMVGARRAGNRGYRLVSILGIVSGVAGAVLAVVSNTISAQL